MKLSIITINYNNASDLEKTIHSVAKQTWRNFEYIIIDGGSKDDSIEVIKRNQQSITHWVSESDRGIYNAMNKGIAKAQGEYLLMLNAGDVLCSTSVLEQVFSKSAYNEDLIACDVYRSADDKIFDKSHFPDSLTFGFLRNGTISHQATFIKRNLHDTVGLYDETLKFASDWKFFILAACRYNASYIHLNIFISICDCSGLTCMPENFPAMKKENEKVLKQYFPAFLKDYSDYDRIKSKTLKRRKEDLLLAAKNFIKSALSKRAAV